MTALDAAVLPELIGYEQATLDAAGIALVIVDTQAADQPVCWTSPAFTTLTGYTAQQVLGRNCRFLQTPTTSPAAKARMRTAINDGQPLRETLLNQRVDGTVFWNELLMTPLHSDGVLTHFAGYQIDVTTRVRAHAAHDHLLEAEQRARTIAARPPHPTQVITLPEGDADRIS